MIEYELTYTVRMIIEAVDEEDAKDKAEDMLSEIAFAYDLDDIRS